MTFAKTMVGLEEFEDEVASDIVAEQPEDGSYTDDNTESGVSFPEESAGIDEDTDSLIDSAQGLEDIISMIGDAPGEDDKPMEPFVERAANVALESNDVVASSGNPLANTAQPDTKAGALDKVKEFAMKVWDMLRNMGKRVLEWVKETWAKYTDRVVKNGNMAKKIKEQLKNLQSRGNANLTDKSILSRIATTRGVEVGEAMIHAYEHAEAQAGRNVMAATEQARKAVDLVASGGSSSEGQMANLLKAIQDTVGEYDAKADAKLAGAIPGNSAATDSYVSAPLFGGYRAWLTIPEDVENLSKYNHGISKLEEVEQKDSVPAPSPQEIEAITDYVIKSQMLVQTYQAAMKELDALNKALDQAAGKARSAKFGSDESKALKQMQAIIPRFIKGPQVAAYAYVVTASTVSLQYCEAGIKAHLSEEDDKSLGDQAKDLGNKAKDKANQAKDSVKNAFSRKAD